MALSQPSATWAITGMGGMGKTQLAVEYAYRYMVDYEKVLWVNTEGQDITAAFAELAPLVGLDLPTGMAVPEKAVAVRCELEAGKCYLLILDNVEERQVCRGLRPRGGETRVIVTTRRANLGFKKLQVDVLPEEEALRLLRRGQEWSQADEEAAKDLCRELGYLTLAVDVAGHVMDAGVKTPGDLLARIRKQGTVEWSARVRVQEADLFDKNPSIAVLLDTSFRMLDESDPLDDLARRMLLVGGWFAPTGTELGLLGEAAAGLLSGAGVEPEPVDEDDLLNAAERLVGLGLGRMAEGERALVFHRVVMECGRRKGGDVGRVAMLEVLGRIATEAGTDTLRLIALSPNRFHFESAVESLDVGSPGNHLLIGLRLVQHLRNTAQYPEALRWGYRLCQLVSEGEWASYFLNIVGQTLHDQGKYEEALVYYTCDLAITEKTLGEEHPETASTLTAIGQTLARRGKYEEAPVCYTRSLAITEKTLGEEHPSTASTLYSMALVREEQGDLDGALEMYERVRVAEEKTIGRGHPDAAMTRVKIGYLLKRQGEPIGEATMREAIGVLEETLGREHPTVKSMKRHLR